MVWDALETLLREIDLANPGQLSRNAPDGARIVLEPAGAARAASGPLPVSIVLHEHGIDVQIHSWTQRFTQTRADDPDDDAEQLALDLVAAVLFGGMRVRLGCRSNGEVLAREFVFLTATGPRIHRSERGWRWPWQTLASRELGNALAVPPTRSLGELGRLPWAPWAGMLDEAATAAGPSPLAIDGELDLHPFSPRDVKPLVLEYIEVCKQRGITELRIVHGKGIGALRRTVHAILAKHPDVVSYRLGGMGAGSWGATLVLLRNADQHPP